MPWNQAPRKHISARAKVNAPKLRRSLTDAERQLWKRLRGDFAGIGTHFRRQVAIDRRVVVEVDGPVHGDAGHRARDMSRDEYLATQGYTVVRATNREVSLDMPSVLTRIAAALSRTTPTPNPSPQGGGKNA